ncbi:unnamed protein product [Medioppia subpectinata]|uniref:Uncharacterized protein n=1 Tax=Medioppia subpectinata TaxID=1979941 RepID=A0A7R9KPV0_9ACAR|nr:unnamed protein product [Medioppia subpectinata]CAG2107470.1 unnamed protein product [Medioppia subpectinata]
MQNTVQNSSAVTGQVSTETNISQIITTSEPMSNEKRMNFEEERTRLYAQLNEKDDEIDKYSQQLEKLKQQVVEQEELIASSRRDNERLQQENESANKEVTQVLQALQELAVNYDQKSQEVESRNREFDTLSEALDAKLSAMNIFRSESTQMKEQSLLQRNRLNPMLTHLMKDLGEVGIILGANSSSSIGELKMAGDCNKIEDEFTVARLYISQIKSEVKAMTLRTQHMECLQTTCNKKIESYEKDLAESKLLISEYEAKMKCLQESMRDIENTKHSLKEAVDHLNEECTKLKAAEGLRDVTTKEKQKEKDSIEKMKKALEQQIEKHRENHIKHLSALRDEIAEKQSIIDQLTEANQKLTLAQEGLQLETNKLK